ncbi:hypothetical protein K438DRAFT_1594282, partial [Mycena galopus ATCC 62051]
GVDGTTLDDSELDADIVRRLQNPIQSSVNVSDDKIFHLSLRMFFPDTNASEATYNTTCAAIHEHNPDAEMFSHHSVMGVATIVTINGLR